MVKSAWTFGPPGVDAQVLRFAVTPRTPHYRASWANGRCAPLSDSVQAEGRRCEL